MSKTYTNKWIDKDGVTRYFQDADATLKLAGIEAGAQANVIEGITVNNQTVSPDINKNVSITIPAAPVQSISKNNSEITPDINGNVNITVPTGAAADKGVDTTIEANSQSVNLPTSSAVASFVNNLTEDVFKKYYDICNQNTTYTRGNDGEISGWTSEDTNSGITLTATITKDLSNNTETLRYEIQDGDTTYVKTSVMNLETDRLIETFSKTVS